MVAKSRMDQWVEDSNRLLHRSYVENRAKVLAPSNIQRVGHAAERMWGDLLLEWLPPQYEIGYRKYVLSENVDASYSPTETDIVIFRPGYPSALRNREEVLPAGILAAFSVKLSLDRAGVKEACGAAANARRYSDHRMGSPRQETTMPFRYGVLAHSHRFGVHAKANLVRAYEEFDLQCATAPRESLDLVCVADLGAWAKTTVTAMPRTLRAGGGLNWSEWDVRTILMESKSTVGGDSSLEVDYRPSPLLAFLSNLYEVMSQTDSFAEPFYRGLIGQQLGAADTVATRLWEPAEVYSEFVMNQMPGKVVDGRHAEWGRLY